MRGPAKESAAVILEAGMDFVDGTDGEVHVVAQLEAGGDGEGADGGESRGRGV